MALKEHARADKRDEFVARINATRNTVLHPVAEDEGALEDSDEPPVVAEAIVAHKTKRITPEIRQELRNKKAETGWSLKELQTWLVETHDIHVVAKTVSNHLNKKD